jgi:hypothetical protein
VDPRRAIALLAGVEDLSDLTNEAFTAGGALSPLRRCPPLGVEPAMSDAEHSAHQPDGMIGGVGGDEGELRAHVFAAH